MNQDHYSGIFKKGMKLLRLSKARIYLTSIIVSLSIPPFAIPME
jgi:hypothetical protein